MTESKKHVCPVWVGYLLASPIRRLFHNPHKILQPYIEQGMTVIDIGCAMGFFSIPMARMVGEEGKVVCVDLQKEMLKKLEKRVIRKKLFSRFKLLHCRNNSLCIDKYKESIDFALAFAVAHEVADVSLFFKQIYSVLKKNAKLLLVEPKGHVSEDDIQKTAAIAKTMGFHIEKCQNFNYARGILLKK